jgi:hypothetical protein
MGGFYCRAGEIAAFARLVVMSVAEKEEEEEEATLDFMVRAAFSRWLLSYIALIWRWPEPAGGRAPVQRSGLTNIDVTVSSRVRRTCGVCINRHAVGRMTPRDGSASSG